MITVDGEASSLKTQLLKSPISEVHEIASQRKMKIDFEVVSSTGPPHNRTFVTTVTVGEFSASGEGSSKKLSKHLASSKVLEDLRKLPPLAKSHAASRLYQHGGYGKKTHKDLDPSLNPISLLGQLRQRRKETLPVYTLVGEEGVRSKEFTIQVQVDSHTARGSGANKKEAKKNAAEAMLQLLGIRSAKPSGADSNSEKTLVNETIYFWYIFEKMKIYHYHFFIFYVLTHYRNQAKLKKNLVRKNLALKVVHFLLGCCQFYQRWPVEMSSVIQPLPHLQLLHLHLLPLQSLLL